MVVISEDFITKNEIMNDGGEIFMYYSKMYGCYITYGFSAYNVWQGLYNQEMNNKVSYSEDYQMPQVLVDNHLKIQLLRSGVELGESIEGVFYHIKTFSPFNDNEYFEWASLIRGE